MDFALIAASFLPVMTIPLQKQTFLNAPMPASPDNSGLFQKVNYFNAPITPVIARGYPPNQMLLVGVIDSIQGLMDEGVKLFVLLRNHI